MHDFIKKHRQVLSICLTVTVSVFVVAFVVSAATTIGNNITTEGNTTISGTASVTGKSTLGNVSSTIFTAFQGIYVGGTATTTINSAGNLSVAGTASVTGLFTPTGGISTSTWDNISLGLVTPSKVSSTLLSVMNTLYVGGTATTTINGSSTSTFLASLAVNETAATSTVHIGTSTANFVTQQGKGGCIALGATSATPSGLNFLYLIVVPKADGSGLELVTSTLARDCGY
jgi:hypothetical protein